MKYLSRINENTTIKKDLKQRSEYITVEVISDSLYFLPTLKWGCAFLSCLSFLTHNIKSSSFNVSNVFIHSNFQKIYKQLFK